MKTVFLGIFLFSMIALSLSGAVSPAFASVEKGINYDREVLQTNPDGSRVITQTFLSYERIFDNGIYKDYKFSEPKNELRLTTSDGFVSLNKNTCVFNFNGEFEDSMHAYYSVNDVYDWAGLDVLNNAECEAYFDQENNSLVAKRYVSLVGFTEYKYIFSKGNWKTQLEITNLSPFSNRVYGFDQTIDLDRDVVEYGKSMRDIDKYDGLTLDRKWLEDNEGRTIKLLNAVSFDFHLGFEYVDSISLIDTGVGKSRLVFHYMRNGDVLPSGDTLIIDPTFGYAGSNNYEARTSLGTGTSCPSWNDITNDGNIQLGASGSSSYCRLPAFEWDTSSIDDSSVINDVSLQWDIDETNFIVNCNINPLTTQPSTHANNPTGSSNLATDIQDGTPYVSNTSKCTSDATATTDDLGSSADADLQALLPSDWFGIGIEPVSMVRDATNRFIVFPVHAAHDVNLQVTYTVAPKPDSITDLSVDSVSKTTATLSFSDPDLNGGSFVNYMLNMTTPQQSAPITVFKMNSTSNLFSVTGLSAGTGYSAQASAFTQYGANWTNANVLNFTTSLHDPPGVPSLGALATSDTSIRYQSVAGVSGANSTIWYGLRCELNDAGSWSTIVSNASLPASRNYEYTGLTFGDQNICQWRDGSVDGWSPWSNNATDTLTLSVVSSQRTSDPDDKLLAFIEFVAGQGGVYFGLGVIPFSIMLIGFMAGKKTVRIFTLATLMLMGMVHASGYYVYPDWYWTLALLFGIGLVMGRMKSD